MLAHSSEDLVVTVAFRFTSADLERMPDIPGVRYEIIDGDLFVSRTPDEAHQYVCVALSSALHAWSIQSGAGMAVPTPGLVFSEDNDVIPDLVWISHAQRARARDEKGHYRFAPELVVEVLSPGSVNERRDRDLKLNLYSRQGVQEYWIVDWREHLLEVYRRPEGELVLVATLRDGDVLATPLLPGFTCPVVSLWAPPLDR
jgi:Uma2 family endonuclease